jgi:hypothetical protein
MSAKGEKRAYSAVLCIEGGSEIERSNSHQSNQALAGLKNGGLGDDLSQTCRLPTEYSGDSGG